jgi:hypothetical protein
MSSVVISGDTSGSITVAAPAVAGTYTQTLPMITGTLGTLNSGTAVASTSGTSIDFTSLPANIRRITVMFRGVSVSGTSHILIQLGTSGGVQITGYVSSSTGFNGSAGSTASSTAGLLVFNNDATYINSGIITITNITSNVWVNSGAGKISTGVSWTCGGDKDLAATLDRVRITTVNGTDTFDAGSINILYE